MATVTADDIGLRTLRNRIRKLEHELAKVKIPADRRARLQHKLDDALKQRTDLLAEYSVTETP